MKIISIDKLNEGDVLGKSIFNDRSELLLSSGYRLTKDMIQLIIKHGFNFVYVMDDATKDIVPEEMIDESVKQMVTQKVAEQFKGVQDNLAFEAFAPDEIKKKLEDDAAVKGSLRMPSVRQQVSQLLEEIVDNQITMFTSLPMKTDGGVDHQHAIDTTLLCILVAQHMNFDHRETRALGTAALIHDVGRMVLGDIAKKPISELSRDEKMMMREHPTYSMMIVRGNDPNSFLEQTTVLQHHERQDGKGFPQGMKGTNRPPVKGRRNDQGQIFRYAEILAVTNAYDSLLSGREDGRRWAPDEAIRQVVSEAGSAWNIHVVKALTQVVQTYPVGVTVRVKQTASHAYVGYTGVVAKANPTDQTKPVLVLTNNSVGAEITPKLLDLSAEKYCSIELLM